MNSKKLYDLQLATIEGVKQSGCKPTLLLHSCCGPCNTYPMEYLSQYFQLTLFFNNHNIYPYSEYKRRFDELLNYVRLFEKKQNIKIEMILPLDYRNETYSEKLRLFANEKEGGRRCNMCFALRLSESMMYAAKNKFEYIATVMSVSRHKNALAIHDIASKLVLKFPDLKYLPSNFKKGNGYNRGIEISKEHNMYRQDYCGCQFSQPCGKETKRCE